MDLIQFNADLAFLAYLPLAEAVSELKKMGCDRVMPLHDSEGDRDEGYLLWHGDKRVIDLRGSDDPKDWIANLDLRGRRWGRYGFAQAAVVIWSRIRSGFELAPDGQVVTIVGHSRGGAIGLHLANLMAGLGYSVELFSYGMPRAASIEWVNQCHSFQHFRVFHGEDLVPHLPPTFLGWQHHGKPVCIGGVVGADDRDCWRAIEWNAVRGLMRGDWLDAHLSYSRKRRQDEKMQRSSHS